jgi:hypothetical protein
MDVDDELRLDWFHAERSGFQADELTLEIEKSFGLLTLEVEVGLRARVRARDRSGHGPVVPRTLRGDWPHRAVGTASDLSMGVG